MGRLATLHKQHYHHPSCKRPSWVSEKNGFQNSNLTKRHGKRLTERMSILQTLNPLFFFFPFGREGGEKILGFKQVLEPKWFVMLQINGALALVHCIYGVSVLFTGGKRVPDTGDFPLRGSRGA